MSDILKRLNPAITLAALCISLLALMTAAAGVGYAAATIGTADLKKNAVTAKKIKNKAVTTKKIKNDAVTSDKVKNGTLGATDLVAQEVEKLMTPGNGGEGDCVWTVGSAILPGLGAPTYRKDRFGTVHLSGIGIRSDGPGGDGVCNPTGPQSSDAILFVLPAGYVPAHSIIVPGGETGSIIVVGPAGITDGGTSLPAGAVAPVPPPGGGLSSLDGVSFEPAGSSVVLPRSTASGQYKGDLGALLGLE